MRYYPSKTMSPIGDYCLGDFPEQSELIYKLLKKVIFLNININPVRFADRILSPSHMTTICINFILPNFLHTS